MADEQNSEEDQTDVCDEELLDIPGDKCGKALSEDNDGSESHTVPGHRSATPGLEGQGVAIDVLCLKSPHECNVADANASPGNESSNGDDVQQPVEGFGSAGRAVHVAEKAHCSGNGGGPVWHALLRSLLEQSWSVTVFSKTDEDSATGVNVRAGCRQDNSQEDRIEDVRKRGNSSELNGNDQWRGASVCITNGDRLIVVGNQYADEENSEDEQGKNAPKCVADGPGHGNTGVGRLSSTNSAELSALVSKTGLDQNSPESHKFRDSNVIGKVRGESTGRIPVLEADVSLRSNAASVHNDSENPEAKQGNNLDGSEPKLKLSKNVNGKEVDSGDRDPEDGDEDGDVQVLVPPLDDETSC